MGCPGGCFGNKTNNDYRSYIPGPIQRLSHGECEGVTTDLLNMFLRLVVCVETHKLYSIVGVSEAEISNAKTLLSNWISLKEQDPGSCEHQEKLPIIQVIVNKIVIAGRC